MRFTITPSTCSPIGRFRCTLWRRSAITCSITEVVAQLTPRRRAERLEIEAHWARQNGLPERAPLAQFPLPEKRRAQLGLRLVQSDFRSCLESGTGWQFCTFFGSLSLPARLRRC